MSTVKTDSVVGSFLPMPIIDHANDVELFVASANQTVFTTTRFNRSSAIKVFAKSGNTFTDVTATWTALNTVTISGISLTAGQSLYIFSVGALASRMVVQRVDGTYTTADVYINELETKLNTINNTLLAKMYAAALAI